MLKKIIALLSLLFFLTSCAAQKTVFVSDPPGAQVTVNGEVVGETPCEYEYKSGAATSYEVVVRKEDHVLVLDKIETDEVDEASRNKWLVAGLVWSPLWVGTFFTKKLKDSYHFALTKIRQVGEVFTDKNKLIEMLSLKKNYESKNPS